MLLHQIFRSEWIRQLIKQGWSDDQPWPSNIHFIPYMIYGLDLQTSQLLCSSPFLKSAVQPWPSDVQIWKFKGVCPAHIFSKSTNSLQNHENSWKFPSTITMVAGGKEILFPCFGVLFRSKCGKINEYFYNGLNRSMELAMSIQQQEVR